MTALPNLAPIPDDKFNAAVRKYKRSRRKNPVHVYADMPHAPKRCVNLTADGKRCVASQIMHDLGFRGGSLDVIGRASTPDYMVEHAEVKPYGTLTDAQHASLKRAQVRADQGAEWWQALKGATV